ncbi:MAG: acyl-CoA thioesterase [Planctomycetales bacterium]|nr:acyl-CoA thioesterase [Planctomycetales bacterium]NIN78599.1 acyl-CoA thioesterase [Planctomycetales bacterium]NIO35793.1 acyl-CoA thioesterase [Planctomycetales bacterium]NIO47544.1 acyl-CoA thioesterase [Planctomycetales bacterium]NIP71081.1 acyl-CoA thioesterase [Planctomycetales bacterium]
MRYTRPVQWRDTDAAGIVHFSVFFNYMEEAETVLLRELGVDVLVTDDQQRYSFPRVSAQCDYQAPVRFGDTVEIDVSLVRLGDSSLTYKFDFSCDGRQVAVGQVTAVYCRLVDEGPPETVPLPSAIREPLGRLIS